MQFFASELFFNDTSGLDSRPQHILLIRKIVGLADSVHIGEVAVNGKFTREHTSQIYSQAGTPTSFTMSIVYVCNSALTTLSTCLPIKWVALIVIPSPHLDLDIASAI